MVGFRNILLNSLMHSRRRYSDPYPIIKALNAGQTYVRSARCLPYLPAVLVAAILLFSVVAVAQSGAGLKAENGGYRQIPRQVTLILETGRLVASNARLSRLDEWVLQTDEQVVVSADDVAVIVVVTNQRILGYGPVVGWRELLLAEDEIFESLLAEDSAAFVGTSARLLNFNADTGIWAQRVRAIP